MTTTPSSSSSPDLCLRLDQNLFIRQAVPAKGVVCSNQERARRLAADHLRDTTTFSSSWGAQVWIGYYQPPVSTIATTTTTTTSATTESSPKEEEEKIFIAIAPVGSGSGLVFQELFAAGCQCLVRYGSDDVKNPHPNEYQTIKLVDITDNLYGFCQASGVPREEWGQPVYASPLLVQTFEQEAQQRQLPVEKRLCHHLENYHSLRDPSTYPHRSTVLQQQLHHLSATTPSNRKESFDMESAVLFRVAHDARKHAMSVLQTVNKEDPATCDPYQGPHLQQALAHEKELFVDYIFRALLRVPLPK